MRYFLMVSFPSSADKKCCCWRFISGKGKFFDEDGTHLYTPNSAGLETDAMCHVILQVSAFYISLPPVFLFYFYKLKTLF
jgi:hypothetical protein